MKLKAFLDSKKMSIQQFAEMLDMPHETVRQWVHGIRFPRPATAKKIIEATNRKVTLTDLYGSN